MLGILRREGVYLWYYFDLQLRQIFPYWVLGMVLGSLISVFIKDRIHTLFRVSGFHHPVCFGHGMDCGHHLLVDQKGR